MHWSIVLEGCISQYTRLLYWRDASHNALDYCWLVEVGWLAVCLAVSLSVWLAVCLPVCLSGWLAVCLSVCLSVSLSVLLACCVRPLFRPSVHLIVDLSISLFVSLISSLCQEH